LSCCY